MPRPARRSATEPPVTLSSFVVALNRWVEDGNPDDWARHLERVGDRINELVDPLGNTVLHLTTLRGTVRGIEDLLDVGANPHALNAEGNTPLSQIRAWANRASTRDCRDALVTGMRNWDIEHERLALHALLDEPDTCVPPPSSAVERTASSPGNAPDRRRRL